MTIKDEMKIIDCDVHVRWKSIDELKPYFKEPWLSRLKSGYVTYGHNNYSNPHSLYRLDARPPDNSAPGSDPKHTATDLLDKYDIDFAVLMGESSHLGISNLTNIDWATVVASAYNDWFINHWFAADKRFLGSIIVATQDPYQAAMEIERVGSHPQFVQVSMGTGATFPYGNRFYHPIYEAAEKASLPIAIHAFTDGVGTAPSPTAAGYPSYYIEYHTLGMHSIQAHMVSMICEGVFEKFPKLKLVLVEGGICWLPSLLWRLDKNWKGLRDEVPWVKRKPSEYAAEHVRLSTQPLEEPANRNHLKQVVDMLPSDKMLLFSSDYPHWDFDDPFQVFNGFSDEFKSKVFFENAAELYNL